jgi:hypothetical protein
MLLPPIDTLRKVVTSSEQTARARRLIRVTKVQTPSDIAISVRLMLPPTLRVYTAR